MTTYVPTKSYQYAFGLNKQSAIGTPVAVGKLIYLLPMDTFAPIDKTYPVSLSDRNKYGKGHDFATYYDQITHRWVIPTRTFSLSPTAALFAPAFVLGKLATVNTSSGTSVYEHSFTFQDKNTYQNCLYMSIIEKGGAAYQRLISGIAVDSFTVDFPLNDHAKISWGGAGRDMAVDATSMPSVTAEDCYFKALGATFKIGSTATDISAQVLGGQIVVSQNPEPKEMPGEITADVGKISYFLIGQQTVSGNLRIFMDATRLNLFLNSTECEMEIKLVGSQIGVTGQYHTITITIPHLVISASALSEEGQMTAVTLTFSELSVLKKGADDIITWKVLSDISGDELLVAA